MAGMLPSGFVIHMHSDGWRDDIPHNYHQCDANGCIAQVAPPIGGGLVINSDGAFFLVGAFGSAVVATLTPIWAAAHQTAIP